MLAGLLISGLSVSLSAGEGIGDGLPYQANGIKVGEVRQTSVIVWTRLTRYPERLLEGVPFPVVAEKSGGKFVDSRLRGTDGNYAWPVPQLPPGVTLERMQDAAPGIPGQVRLVYWPERRQRQEQHTDWFGVEPNKDFTRQFRLGDLTPGTQYSVRCESRIGPGGSAGQTVQGRFKTAPAPETSARVVFTVVTGQDFHKRDDTVKGHQIFPLMQALDPDFFVHTGDILYYDRPRPSAISPALARFHWNRTYALPFQRAFHNHVPSYFMKDDHDTLQNDCWPSMDNQRMGELTFAKGQAIFREQVPMGPTPYRTVRWGKDLQIWLIEGRDFRSPNTMPDGPDKTIWGEKQKKWFKRTVSQSNATFKILISPTPLVGPDRENKNDNHSNQGFTHEGRELRNFIGQQKNMVVVCGDRHWQYISVDPQTGVREYSCGPTSDAHAGGFREDMREPMHRYLNICGGFLSVTVERRSAKATLTFRHHSVDGTVLNEDQLTTSL